MAVAVEVELKGKFEVRPSRLGACCKLAGDVAAGVLLYSIHLRQTFYTPIQGKDGHEWVVLTRPQWMIDTSLTRHQYDRALKLLKKKNLVVVEYKKLHKKDQHQKTWLRIPAEILSAVTDIMQPKKESANAEKATPVESAQADVATEQESAISDDKNENLLENEEEINVAFLKTTNSSSPGEVSKSVIAEEDVEVELESWFKTANDYIYAGCKAIGKEVYSKKRAIKLKTIVSDLEGHDTSSLDMLRRAVEMWPHFKAFAEIFNKAFNMPEIPQLWAIAMQLKAVPHFYRYVDFYRDMSASEKYPEYFSLCYIESYKSKLLITEEEAAHNQKKHASWI